MGGLTFWIARRQWILTRDIADKDTRDAAAALVAERDRAYSIVRAEWWRVWALSSDWNNEDLLLLAATDLLDPDIVLPLDWSAATASAAVMGIFPARWVASAFNEMYVLRRRLQTLAAAVAAYSWHDLNSSEHAAELAQMRTQEANIKEHLLEAANILEDALAEDPDVDKPREFPRRDTYHSKLVARLANKVDDRARSKT